MTTALSVAAVTASRRGLLARVQACCWVASARLLTPRSKFRAVMASPQIKTTGTTYARQAAHPVRAADNAPPKWMFRNITAIRENTDRILQLLESGRSEPAGQAPPPPPDH